MADTDAKEMASRYVNKYCDEKDPLEAKIREADDYFECEAHLERLTNAIKQVRGIERMLRDAYDADIRDFTADDEIFFESLYRTWLNRAESAERSSMAVKKAGFELNGLPVFQKAVAEIRDVLDTTEWARASAHVQDDVW